MYYKNSVKAWVIEDRTPIVVKPLSPVYIQNKCSKKTSQTSIKRMYAYIKGDTLGFKEFMEYLKNKYPEAAITSNGRSSWEFDPDAILAEFWAREDFRSVLDEQGLDDFDRLYFWASKECKHIK